MFPQFLFHSKIIPAQNKSFTFVDSTVTVSFNFEHNLAKSLLPFWPSYQFPCFCAFRDSTTSQIAIVEISASSDLDLENEMAHRRQ